MWFFGRHASGHWYSFVKGIELLREITDPTKLPIPWFLLDKNQGNLLRDIDNKTVKARPCTITRRVIARCVVYFY